MISVIIPTYNRNRDLESCLKSIRNNSRSDIEIIVLHPKLDPETDTVCATYGALSVFDEARVNGKRVKSLWGIINHGIELATNRYVCWLNDDCIVLPDWDSLSLDYFKTDLQLALLVLKTKGILQNPEFRVATTEFGTLVANYGILDKKTGYRFDEKYNWFYGDVDLPLQIARDSTYRIIGTSENMVIHNHIVDTNRIENENDPRSSADRRYYMKKWWPYKNKDGKLLKKNIVEYFKIMRAINKIGRSIKSILGMK